MLSIYIVLDDSVFSLRSCWEGVSLVLFLIWMHHMKTDEFKLIRLHLEFEDMMILDLQLPGSNPALDQMLNFLHVQWCSELRSLNFFTHSLNFFTHSSHTSFYYSSLSWHRNFNERVTGYHFQLQSCCLRSNQSDSSEISHHITYFGQAGSSEKRKFPRKLSAQSSAKI